MITGNDGRVRTKFENLQKLGVANRKGMGMGEHKKGLLAEPPIAQFSQQPRNQCKV